MNSSFPLCWPDDSISVLVIDDDEFLNATYANFFSAKGASVVACCSLADATEIIQQSESIFDAIVLDNQLGDGDGVSLLPLLGQKQASAAVIMVSANDVAEFLVASFHAGIDDYMVKPINLDLLWLKITRSVSQQRLKALAQHQQLELVHWVSEEQQQQELAKHLFDNMFNELSQPNPAVYAWLKPQAIFSGDAVLRYQGQDGSWYFMLADAMGHGLAPAISLMPMLQCFQAMSHKALPLSSIVFELNSNLNRLLPDDRFVAAVLVKVSPWSKQLEIWNGGMPAVLLIGRDGKLVSQVVSKHMALGIMSNSQIAVMPELYELSNVAGFVLHSDGLTETPMANGSVLNVDSIVSLLQSNAAEPFKEVAAIFTPLACPDDISLCWIDCDKLLAPPADNVMLAHQVQNSFSASFTMTGQAIVNADIPARVTDLLRAQNFPPLFLQQVFTVCTELFVNAFEHGVLALDSAVKEVNDSFVTYYEQKEQRITHLTENDFIDIKIQWLAHDNELTIHVVDSGAGFAKELDDITEAQFSGRGIAIINQLCKQLEILPPGNNFKATISSAKNGKQICGVGY